MVMVRSQRPPLHRPDDRTFDRYTMVDPLTYGEYWDECRYWLLVTAFLIENS